MTMPGTVAAPLPSTLAAPGAAALSLVLIRHAATEWTETGRYQGRRDIPLSKAGMADASALAASLRDAPIDLIISSPLARALQTAQPLATATGAPLCLDHRLIELCFGEWEGLTQDEVRGRWPDALWQWKHAPSNARPAGGESLPEALVRLQGLLWDLTRLGSGARFVALVTHKMMVRLALLAAAGTGLERIRHLDVPPASAHTLALRNGRLAL
jgi:broad specificity phosphatase PhoE